MTRAHRLARAALLLAPAVALAPTHAQSLPPAATDVFYVGDFQNDRVVVYDENGALLRTFTAPGLDGPRGILFAPGGGFLVASEVSDEVFVFDAAEQFQFKFGHAQLNGPTGMALSPAGELHVSSFQTDRILVFGFDGVFARSYTAPGFARPNCVAFDSLGRIYAASASTGRVFQWDADEQFLTSFTATAPVQLTSPMSIARDENDVLYVSGGSSHNIVLFDTNGTTLDEWTHPDLTGPQGVAFDDRGHVFSSSFFLDQLVELDASGNHVQTITQGALDTPRSVAFRRTETPFATYCTAKSGLICGVPAISALGTSSASKKGGPGADFTVFASPARSNKAGVLIYSDAGRAALPFQGGLLCVQPTPLRRSVPTNSGGTPGNNCDGSFAIDLNAFAAGELGGNPDGFLSQPGTLVTTQWWGRDAIATGSYLSDGLEYSVGP